MKPSLAIVVGCVLALAAVVPKVGQAQVFDGELAGQGVLRVITGGGWGTGFIINDQGYVITNWHVVYDHRNGRYASDLSVILNNTQEQIPVTLIMASSELDFAIVKAQSSLGRPSVPLATVTPKPGGGVFLVGYPGVAISFKGSPNVSSTSAGVVSRVIMGDWGRGGNFPLIQHTSEANPGNSGGPLFDSCGRVIGIHTQSPKVRVVDGGRVSLVPAGAGIFFASHVVITMTELKSRGIPFDEQTDVCTPPAGGIMEDPEARAQAEQAKREAAKAKAASEKNRIETEVAKAQAGQAEQQVRSITTQLLIWGPIFAIFMIVTFVLALKKPRQVVIQAGKEYSRQISRRLSRSSKRTRERTRMAIDRGLRLSGTDPEGSPVRLDISAEQLSTSGGLVIGRSAEYAQCVINRSAVSRTQARIRIDGGRIMIEDMNSTNGTRINGRKLSPRHPSEIRLGDQISFGMLKLTVSQL